MWWLVLAAAAADLPEGFPLSPATWGGEGGAPRESCASLAHDPVIFVHDDGEGPSAWTSEWEAFDSAGFGPCELWALRTGEEGRPWRSLEELTDDLKFFMGSVLSWTRAPKVQIVARGSGAVLAHATLKKYRLHALVHTAIYIDGPFAGLGDCTDDRCFSGSVRCCSLKPGSLLLRRALLPIETPEAEAAEPDEVPAGHLRYVALGSSGVIPLDERGPGSGGWMLDGAANLSFPGLNSAPLHEVEGAWEVAVEALSRPVQTCPAERDADGDGFCPPEAGGADCDDTDATIHPGAEEVEADNIDQDCNGFDTDRRYTGWACERPLVATAPVVAPPAPVEERSWWWAIFIGGLGVLVGGGLVARRWWRG